MSREPDVAIKLCPECGAENITLAKRCWMCRADLSTALVSEPVNMAGETTSDQPDRAAKDRFNLALTVGVAGLIVLVGFGIGRAQPMSLILYAVLVVPAFLATAIRSGRKRAKGEHMGWEEQLSTFLVSISFVAGILAMAGVALFVGLCIYCFESFNVFSVSGS